MSIHNALQLKQLIAKVSELEQLIKTNGLQTEIDLLKSRVEALEQRPKPGRPPKEQNG